MNEQKFWFWNTALGTWTVPSVWNVRDTVRSIQSWKKEETKKSQETQRNQMLDNSRVAYQCSLNSNNWDLKSRYVSLSNLTSAEAIIQQAAQEHGSTAYDWLGSWQIFCRFTQKNPKYEKINNDLLDDKIDIDSWATQIWAYSHLPKEVVNNEYVWEPTEYEEPSILQNIAQWAVDTIEWPVKAINNYVVSPIAEWITKMLPWTDNEQVARDFEESRQNFDESWNIFNADRESLSYWLSNLVTDLWVTAATSFIPWVGEAKWAWFLAKYPKYAKILWTASKRLWSAEKLVEKYPVVKETVEKMVKWAKIWIKDWFIMRALDAEWTDLWDITFDWLLWGSFPIVWKIGNAVLDKTKLTWLISQKKLEKIQDELAAMWWEFKWNLEWVSKWMDSWWISWTAKQMAKKLNEIAQTSKTVVDELAASITTRYKSEAVDKALNAIRKTITETAEDWTSVAKAWLEEELTHIDELLANWWEYLPSQIRETQSLIGKWLNPFKKNEYWEAKENASKEWYAKLYRTIKWELENIFKKEWLWDIKWLNNLTAVSTTFKNALEDKAPSEMVTTLLPAAVTTAASFIKDWDIESAILWWLPVLALTPYWRTTLSRLFRKMQWWERQTFTKWLDSKWKEVLSESQTKRIIELMKKDESTRWQVKEMLPKLIDEASEAWAIKWWEAVYDMFSDSEE